MRIVERSFLGVFLAATLATLLFVARNRLAPVQQPLTFGLVVWTWVVLLYAAVVVALLAVGGLATLLAGLRRLPAWLASGAAAGFAIVALASNPRAVASLFAFDGPPSSRVLVPVGAVLCALALFAIAAPVGRRRAVVRIGALLAVITGLLALLPGDRGRSARAGTLTSARLQGQRFALVGVDGADWRFMEPLMARGELPHLQALKVAGAWGPLETLRPTLSPAIWTSIATGKLPRRHGVRDFATRRLRGAEETLPDLHLLNRLGFPFLFARLEAAGQVFQAPITSFTRRVPAFWNIASTLGSPVSAVNWWGTWPAEPVIGHMISVRAYYHELVHRAIRPIPRASRIRTISITRSRPSSRCPMT